MLREIQLGARGRIPSLDGLRAVSICLVMFAHLFGTLGFLGVSAIRVLGDPGFLGVRIFFVISGFLITTLLLEELDAKQQISLKSFYIRRFFRIFPAAYTYIGAVAVFQALGIIYVNRGELLRAVSYTSNYLFPAQRSWYLGHLWSLSVEEQFYLIWPCLIYFAGKRRALFVAAAMVAAVPIIRAATWEFFPAARPGINSTFESVADILAAGCMLAGLRTWLGKQEAYLRFLESRWFVLVPVAIFLINVLQSRHHLFVAFGPTIMNLGIALCIDHCVRFPMDLAGRFLNWRPVEALGALSYSLYLWQQPFLNRKALPSLLTSFPVNVLLALIFALLSYHLVEKPSLAAGRKLVKRLRGRKPPSAQEVVLAPGQIQDSLRPTAIN